MPPGLADEDRGRDRVLAGVLEDDRRVLRRSPTISQSLPPKRARRASPLLLARRRRPSGAGCPSGRTRCGRCSRRRRAPRSTRPCPRSRRRRPGSPPACLTSWIAWRAEAARATPDEDDVALLHGVPAPAEAASGSAVVPTSVGAAACLPREVLGLRQHLVLLRDGELPEGAEVAVVVVAPDPGRRRDHRILARRRSTGRRASQPARVDDDLVADRDAGRRPRRRRRRSRTRRCRRRGSRSGRPPRWRCAITSTGMPRAAQTLLKLIARGHHGDQHLAVGRVRACRPPRPRTPSAGRRSGPGGRPGRTCGTVPRPGRAGCRRGLRHLRMPSNALLVTRVRPRLPPRAESVSSVRGRPSTSSPGLQNVCARIPRCPPASTISHRNSARSRRCAGTSPRVRSGRSLRRSTRPTPRCRGRSGTAPPRSG